VKTRPGGPAVRAGEAGPVGLGVPRIDAGEKLSGQARFAGDVSVPRMLHGKVLRSHQAHARIRALRTEKAEAVPGVVAVLTGRDVLDLDPYYGHLIRDRPILALDRVLFAGEPVAAVAAEDEATAESALRLIEVEYEPLPALGGLEEALAPGAPLLHRRPLRTGPVYTFDPPPADESNVCFRYRDVRGSGAEAVDGGDVVVEGEYRFPAVYQYALEPHTVIAEHDGREIRVCSACQHPFLVRLELAALFGLPPSRVRLVVPYVGGGFGSKSYTKMEPLAVALARKAGRPVRIANTVEEAMVTTRRHSMRCVMRTAASREGRLLAREVRIWMETGAYADNGPTVTAIAGMAAPGPYRWGSVAVEASCVYTNRPPAGSYRGFGSAHLQWIGESQVDEVARRLGIDRLEIRRRNLLRRGEVVHPRLKPLDADLLGDLDRVAAALRWGTAPGADRGRGLAVGVAPGGASATSSAIVRMDAAGDATVIVGTTEIGQGAHTVLAQIAAETLALPLERVRVERTDTRYTPFDRSTGASRSTTVAGLAVQRAAQDVLERLLETAGAVWEASRTELRVGAGGIECQGLRKSYAELIRVRCGAGGGELVGRGEVTAQGELAGFPLFWEVCVAGAEVALDPETGVVRVERTVTVADVGRAINPQLVERQDEGCTLQAIGNTLFEEMEFSGDGQLLNPSLLTYRVPTIADVPPEMACIVVENEDGPGPFGAKGCGEGVFGGMPAAIVNAVADAGVPVRELPLTPERVWRRLRERRGEAGGAHAAPSA
jgi:CO/xanthine dehydrogenase Mo-binding subunit